MRKIHKIQKRAKFCEGGSTDRWYRKRHAGGTREVPEDEKGPATENNDFENEAFSVPDC